MRDKDIQALKALAEKATPGPWGTYPITDDDLYPRGLSIVAENGTTLSDEDTGPGEKDAAFIAAANPQAILSLIASHEQQAARIAELERFEEQAIRARDEHHDMADKLAAGIAEHFGQDIGEHSSANCPWTNALELLDTKPEFAPCAAAQRHAVYLSGLTEKQIVAAGRALADRHAEVCNVDKDDNWKIYSESFIDEARFVLTAALSTANAAQAGGAGSGAGGSGEGLRHHRPKAPRSVQGPGRVRSEQSAPRRPALRRMCRWCLGVRRSHPRPQVHPIPEREQQGGRQVTPTLRLAIATVLANQFSHKSTMTNTTNSGAAATQAPSGEALRDPRTFALADRIVKAVLADEQSEGCDISAGLFGKNLSALIAEIATAPAPAAPAAGDVNSVLRDMVMIQEACGLHTDEYAPGSVIEYIKELESDLAAAPAAKAEPVEVWHFMRQRSGTEWVRTDADEETCLKRMPHWKGVFEFKTMYSTPAAQADDVRDAIERAAQICEATCVCDNGQEDYEINWVLRNRAAQIRHLAKRTTSAAPADQGQPSVHVAHLYNDNPYLP